MFPFRYSFTSNFSSLSSGMSMSKISPGMSWISDQSSSNMVQFLTTWVQYTILVPCGGLVDTCPTGTQGRLRFSIRKYYWEWERLVTRIVHEFFKHSGNFFPVLITKFATLCFHEIINHTPIGIGFHTELWQRFESRVKQIGVVFDHVYTIHDFGARCQDPVPVLQLSSFSIRP